MMFRVPPSPRARLWLLLWLLPWLALELMAHRPHPHDLRAPLASLSARAPAISGETVSVASPLAQHEECLLCRWLLVAASAALIFVALALGAADFSLVAFRAQARRHARAAMYRGLGRGPPSIEVTITPA